MVLFYVFESLVIFQQTTRGDKTFSGAINGSSNSKYYNQPLFLYAFSKNSVASSRLENRLIKSLIPGLVYTVGWTYFSTMCSSISPVLRMINLSTTLRSSRMFPVQLCF